MSYQPQWTHANGQGRLTAGVHTVHLIDAQEVASAINRRRLLTYQTAQDFSSHLHSGAAVRASTIEYAYPLGFQEFRGALTSGVLTPSPGGLGGDPPTPTDMDWLWPIGDGDEDKILVSGYVTPPSGCVGLMPKINGTNQWTDANLSPAIGIRAVHFNELRQAVEYVRRGRWDVPVYWLDGLNSALPDTPWTQGLVAHTPTGELRGAGLAFLRSEQPPTRGLIDVTVRPSSVVEVTADADCTVEVYHCLRPLDFVDSAPTWNEYDPLNNLAWATPGGTGGGDAMLLGTVELQADVPGEITGSSVAAGLQAIVDGGEQNFLIRRVDVEWLSVAVSTRLVIEFDLDAPPN